MGKDLKGKELGTGIKPNTIRNYKERFEQNCVADCVVKIKGKAESLIHKGF